MKKITTEIRYSEMSFELIREVKGLRMFFTKESDYCIIVDKEDNVLFEINADCGQNIGYLEDNIVNVYVLISV